MTQLDINSINEIVKEQIANRLTEEEIAERKRISRADPTRLSYWFPKLLEANLPVPKTIIIEATDAELNNAYSLLDDVEGEAKDILSLVDRIKSAADQIGYPCFLRTDHTSAKHNWEKSCYLPNDESILLHVMEIIEFSECACIPGLPCDVWAVRELLPTVKYGVCQRYGDMPVAKEFRCFVDGDKLECMHPYWTHDSLVKGDVFWTVRGDAYGTLCDTFDREAVADLAVKAGGVLGGRWSVDIVSVCHEAEREDVPWYITDLALAEVSWHWQDCARYKKWKEEQANKTRKEGF